MVINKMNSNTQMSLHDIEKLIAICEKLQSVANSFLKSDNHVVSDISVLAANMQVSANAITKLASDVAAMKAVAQSADLNEIVEITFTANKLIQEVAEDAEEISLESLNLTISAAESRASEIASNADQVLKALESFKNKKNSNWEKVLNTVNQLNVSISDTTKVTFCTKSLISKFNPDIQRLMQNLNAASDSISNAMKLIASRKVSNPLIPDQLVEDANVASTDSNKTISLLQNTVSLSLEALGQLIIAEKQLETINYEFKLLKPELDTPDIPLIKNEKQDVYDEIYIENAGLVITSSYLPLLFEKFNLTEEGQFKSVEDQEKGVLLLQYLMMNEPPLNEHHLPLNKILCGLQVDHSIEASLKLSSEEKKVISGLIEAIIGYWSDIGHSTIEGFQGSWLWRKGKLEHKEESWELKVEQHSYDILLDRLPFSLSPIKFSWMEKPLIVKWR